MVNAFYNASGNPASGSDGLSSLMRTEFASIAVAFDMLPQINTTGAFTTTFVQQGNFTFTLPAGPGTLATLTDMATEATARSTADTANATAISTETTTRAAADALLAPKNAPVFTTSATLSYTLATLDNSNLAVSSKWVANFLAASGFAPAGASPVTQVAGRTGNVTLAHTDITDWTAAIIATDQTVIPPYLQGFLGGLRLSNDVSSSILVLDIASGLCVDSTSLVAISLPAITKSVGGSWSAGSGNNGMGTGLTATALTWYHVFAAIISGVADVFFDTSPVAAHAPAGTTAFRRIGSFKLDQFVHILAFNQTGDRFDLGTPITEFNGGVGTTSGVAQSLIGVPTGVVVQALLSGIASDSVSGSDMYLSSLAQADVVPNSATAETVRAPFNVNNSYHASIVTNTSAQIRRRSNSTSQTITGMTNGWIDTRGRG